MFYDRGPNPGQRGSFLKHPRRPALLQDAVKAEWDGLLAGESKVFGDAGIGEAVQRSASLERLTPTGSRQGNSPGTTAVGNTHILQASRAAAAVPGRTHRRDTVGRDNSVRPSD